MILTTNATGGALERRTKTMATRYFSTTEVGEMLGVSREYVNRLCRQKRLGRRVGRNWAISRHSLKKYLDGTNAGELRRQARRENESD